MPNMAQVNLVLFFNVLNYERTQVQIGMSICYLISVENIQFSRASKQTRLPNMYLQVAICRCYRFKALCDCQHTLNMLKNENRRHLCFQTNTTRAAILSQATSPLCLVLQTTPLNKQDLYTILN